MRPCRFLPVVALYGTVSVDVHHSLFALGRLWETQQNGMKQSDRSFQPNVEEIRQGSVVDGVVVWRIGNDAVVFSVASSPRIAGERYPRAGRK